MTVKLLIEQHLVFLSLKEDAQARLSLHMSKCHIVGNHMSRLNYINPSLAEPNYRQAHVISVLISHRRAAKVQASMRNCTVSHGD